jgi:predicted ATPase
VIVPTKLLAKEHYAARTIRPKIRTLLAQFLKPFANPTANVVWQKEPTLMDGSLLEKLAIDRSVQPVSAFVGGSMEATRRLKEFLQSRLGGYATRRNKPDLDGTSQLSPYLHFGHIGSHTVALAVQEADAPLQDRTAFLEELIVRRELAVNFVRYNSNYENFDSCEAWADVTLRKHVRDHRRFLYTEKELQNAMLVVNGQWKNLDPAQRHQRTLEAIKRLLLRESQVQPLLLVIEDLHWIDSETQALLDSLIESLSTARLLLLVNYRPEYQHGWGSKTYYSQLRIDPLPPESAGALLQTILGNDPSLRPLKQLLIERTEGNPFFIEESVRTLVETKILVGEGGNYRLAKPIESTQVPATVQAVLAARIDRLPPDEKRLLQSAAVIGKDVPFALLQAIADQSQEEIRLSLARLQAAEFLYETSLFPEIEYTFKHALTHEVAYGSVLQERRRVFHARIVEAIEKLYSERVTEQVERLAHHASRGELWEKAVNYLHQAGKKAVGHSATGEAIAYFEQALEVLGHLPKDHQTIEQAINIRVDLGPALIATSGFSAPEVEENYTRARVLCERSGETLQLFPVLWGLARVRDTRGELKEGRVLAEQLLDLAERAQEPALLLEAHHELWANLSALGELTTARLHVERGFALYDPRKHRQHAFLYGGHDPGVCCAFHAAEVLWQLGYPDQALQKSRDSLIMARELSHPSTMSFALSFAAWFHQCRGDRQAVKANVEESMALATEQGFSPRRGEDFLRGWLLVEEGDSDAGITHMSKILGSQVTRRLSSRWMAHCAALLAEVLRQRGRISEALNVVTEAIGRTQQSGGRYYEAELHRIKGELLLAQSPRISDAAENCIIQAIEVASRQSAKSLELRAAMSLSRLWQRQGKMVEARQLLGDIYGWFTEGFETGDLKAAKALFNELT